MTPRQLTLTPSLHNNSIYDFKPSWTPALIPDIEYTLMISPSPLHGYVETVTNATLTTINLKNHVYYNITIFLSECPDNYSSVFIFGKAILKLYFYMLLKNIVYERFNKLA